MAKVVHPRTRTRFLVLVAAVIPIVLVGPATAAAAPGRRIVVSTTIQAAVNSARPGDTVVVPPGTYVESVLINTSGITIEGSHRAIIDAGGATNAIAVGTGAITPGPDGFPVCPPPTLRNVTVRGLTVHNATRNGIQLRGVDGFRITGGIYTGNDEYGIFPICSRRGVIEGNRVDGSNDTGIYVGEDDLVSIVGNQVFDNTAGIEIENSTRIVARGNVVTANTVGIFVFVFPGRPFPITDDVVVEGNVVSANNRPNPEPPGTNALSLVPSGTGILNVAADHVVIRRNVVTDNNTAGVGIVASPLAGLDPRVEPNPDNNRVVDNVIVNNGSLPDVARNGGRPGADIVYDGSGVGNCFARNQFGRDFPPGITALFACG